ncbi:MAG: urea ABC transporter permease subunit UrtB [Chthoniobacteraceae bacterium]
MLKLPILSFFLIALLQVVAAGAAAGSADESAARTKLVQAILASGDEQQKALDELANTPLQVVRDALHSWTSSEIYIYKSPGDGTKVPVILATKENTAGRAQAIRIDTGKPVTDDKGAALVFFPKDLTSLDTEMGAMSSVQAALDMLALSDTDKDVRLEAVVKSGKSQKVEMIPILQGILEKEKNGRIKKAIHVSIATLRLNDDTAPDVQIKAANELASLSSIGSLDDLQSVVDDPDAKPQVIKAAQAAIKSIHGYLSIINFFGTIFRGLSLGSILLVVALGLAITFGLMGIINMAHGEMIAIGGYTSYVVQNLFMDGFAFHVTLPITIGASHLGFGLSLPGLHAVEGSRLFECYFLVVIPLSFIMSALAGLLLERAVIQFLYRRPLESLLATWGVSLCMQQCFRLVFGANNVQIKSPAWLSGNFTMFDIAFGYNRIFVIGFAILIVIGTWVLLTKTPLGLLIRAVMQNRDMAACMGVPTQRVNMLTFAFGSGLAGLAGAFLSQITNVGPGMGQTWIVDSFMTVVVGGVGSIVGTIYASLGIGTADQVLQQVFGSPVIGKITALIAIILFLQWKPGGLFPTRSRSLEG